jgi:uncharacterized protein (TIRG00374 family)
MIKWTPRRQAQVIASAILASILLAILLYKISPGQIIVALKQTSFPAVAMSAFLYGSANVMRSLRFKIISASENVGAVNFFFVTCVYNLFTGLMPIGTGELSYPYLLKRYYHLSFSENVSTVLLARALDFVVIFSFFLASLIALQRVLLPNWGQIVLPGLGLIFLLLILLFAYSGARGFLVALLDDVVRKAHAKRFKHVNAVLQAFQSLSRALERDVSPTALVWSMLLTSLVWTTTYALLHLLFLGMGHRLNFWQVVFSSSLVIVAMILPLQGIAGFGTQEAGWAAGLIILGFGREQAITMGFGVHVILFIFLLLLGGIGLGGLLLGRPGRICPLEPIAADTTDDHPQSLSGS